jgi:CubicO group peptidase (beta-lactamase class C family)
LGMGRRGELMEHREIKRRQLGRIALAAALLPSSPAVLAQSSQWGADRGYPTGLAGGLARDPAYRVGNYSGGFESALPVRRIGASGGAARLPSNPVELRIRRGSTSITTAQYLDAWPVTGLLIVRQGVIRHESYRFGRTANMRLSGWSMAKSITSLLLGICVDRGLVKSMEDKADRYVPELKGTLFGSFTLHNLANMTSGADVDHDRDNPTIYPKALLDRDSSIRRVVTGWDRRRGEQGQAFRYTELCPLTIGMVIRQVTGTSMSAFASEVLWQPMGAEGDASWLCDSERNEFNCMGFGAELHDWARLGMLVAQRGSAQGRQIVSERWIDQLTRWTAADSAVRFGAINNGVLKGYKFFMWHTKPDGSRPAFVGHHGQRVYVDLPTQTVLVQTAIDHQGIWEQELYALFEAAVAA